jgi:lysophospholipase L1-like esterase
VKASWLAAGIGMAAAALGACGGSAPDAPAQAVTLRVLAAGDSITYGAGGNLYGYRLFLHDLSAAAGIDVHYVGSQSENLGPGTGHEGHPGWRTDELQAAIGDWLERERPDVVLLHIGTNDIFQGRPLGDAVASLESAVRLIGSLRPAAWTVLATPGPYRSPKNAQAQQLAAHVRRIVEQRSAAGQRILLADVHAALAGSPAALPALLGDSAHPSDLGYYLMAKSFHAPLRRIADERR